MRAHAPHLAAVLVSAALVILAGCDSDPVAPHDQLQLTPEEAAGQAGYLAWALVRMGPEFLQDPAGGAVIGRRDPDTLVFSGAITGACDIGFEDADGSPTTWNLATRAWLVTQPDAPLEFTPIAGSDAVVRVTLDLEAAIARPANVATISGSGTLGSGSLTTAFVLAIMEVPLSGWPTGGTLSASVAGHAIVVTFDGDQLVNATVDGRLFRVDLLTGEASFPD